MFNMTQPPFRTLHVSCCQDIVAYHKVIEGRGCALQKLDAKLKMFPSDEDESLYIGSTQPTYAMEAEKEWMTLWIVANDCGRCGRCFTAYCKSLSAAVLVTFGDHLIFSNPAWCPRGFQGGWHLRLTFNPDPGSLAIPSASRHEPAKKAEATDAAPKKCLGVCCEGRPRRSASELLMFLLAHLLGLKPLGLTTWDFWICLIWCDFEHDWM